MTDTGWAPRTKLPPGINQPGLKVGALYSPTGRTLMFARDTGSELSGELFVWHIDGTENWPPGCATGEEIKK